MTDPYFIEAAWPLAVGDEIIASHFEDVRKLLWIKRNPERAYNIPDYATDYVPDSSYPGGDGAKPNIFYGDSIIWKGELWYCSIDSPWYLTNAQVVDNWEIYKPPDDIHPDDGTWVLENNYWILGPKTHLFHHYDQNAKRYITDRDADGSFPTWSYRFHGQWPTHRWLPKQTDPNEQIRPEDEDTLQFDRHGPEMIKEFVTIIDAFGPQHGSSEYPFPSPGRTPEYLFNGLPGADELEPAPAPANPDPQRLYEPGQNAGLQNQLFMECARTAQRYMYRVDDTYEENALAWFEYFKVGQLINPPLPAPNEEGTSWTASTYIKHAVVAYEWRIYRSNAITGAGDVPGVSGKWTRTYFEYDDIYVEEFKKWARGDESYWGQNGSHFEKLLIDTGEYDWYLDTNVFYPIEYLGHRDAIREITDDFNPEEGEPLYSPADILEIQDTCLPLPGYCWRKMPRYTMGKKDIMWPKERGDPPEDPWQARWPIWPEVHGIENVTYFNTTAPYVAGIYLAEKPEFALTEEEQELIDKRHGPVPGEGFELYSALLNDVKAMLDLQTHVRSANIVTETYQFFRVLTFPILMDYGPFDDDDAANVPIAAEVLELSIAEYDAEDGRWSVNTGEPLEIGYIKVIQFDPLGVEKFYSFDNVATGGFKIIAGKLLGIYDAVDIFVKMILQYNIFNTVADHDTPLDARLAIDGEDGAIQIPVDAGWPPNGPDGYPGAPIYRWLHVRLDENDRTGEVASPLVYFELLGIFADVEDNGHYTGTDSQEGVEVGVRAELDSEIILKIDFDKIPSAVWALDYTNHK